MKADGIGHVAEVGRDGDLESLRAESEADGIDGVMRNGEAGDVDVADGKRRSSRKGFDLRSKVFRPRDHGRGEARNVNRNIEFSGNHLKPCDVIAVLVGDE